MTTTSNIAYFVKPLMVVSRYLPGRVYVVGYNKKQKKPSRLSGKIFSISSNKMIGN